MNNEQIWEAALGEIELNLSRANFTTWFKNTFISQIDEDNVIICVPNLFTKTWLEKKYDTEIKNALTNIINKEIKEIIYKIETKKENNQDNSFSFSKKEEASVDNNINENINKIKTNSFSRNRFGLNTRYVFENFIVGKGNELAHAACRAVAANPGKAYNPLFIYGGVGLGKTHLLQAIGHKLTKETSKILYVTSEKFANDYIQAIKSGLVKNFKEKYRNIDLLLIDDIQFLAGKDGTQEEFFHTFNELHQSNKQIVITSDRVPKSIPALEKRLLSRFEWGMVADISKPNIETRIAILEQKCKEKNYILSDDVLFYIANNIKNNIRELEGALNKIIAFYQFNNSTPSIETTKNILNNLLLDSQNRTITAKDIISAVSKFYGIEIKDLIGKGRKKELVWPRQITIFLMREEIKISYPTIGQELGGRDHTTAMHAYNKIKKEIKKQKIKQEIESIKQLLNDLNSC